MMEILSLPSLIALLSLSWASNAVNITITKPEFQQLLDYPSVSPLDGHAIQWSPSKAGQPATLFLWKGTQDNFTKYFQIGDIYHNTNVDNDGAYNWVVGGVPYSGKDYCVELKVAGESFWSDYFELYNEKYPDPMNAPVPKIKNITPFAAQVTGKGGASATGTGGASSPSGSGGESLDGASAAGASQDGSGNGDNKSGSSGSFSTAAFAGAIAGAVIGTALICTVVFLLISRRRNRHHDQQQPYYAHQTVAHQAPPLPPPAPPAQTATPVNGTHQLETKPYQPSQTPVSAVTPVSPVPQYQRPVANQYNNHGQQDAYQLENTQWKPEMHAQAQNAQSTPASTPGGGAPAPHYNEMPVPSHQSHWDHRQEMP